MSLDMSGTDSVNFRSQVRLVRRMAHELGFALVGVTPAEKSDNGSYIRRWLDDGKHGEMSYLSENLEKRLDPTKYLPGAKTVISVADRYPVDREEQPATDREPVGRIARYAWGDDYHKVIKKRLHRMADALRIHWPNEQYRSAVDTAPILERDHAQRCGLGWIGKHTLLIHPDLGSWLLLGQIITTLVIEADELQPPMTDHCGTCTRCIDACPTDCIRPYQLDASRCISYLTIEHRESIEPTLQPLMGDWVAGCDVCQQVCPFNANAESRELSAADNAVPPPFPPLAKGGIGGAPKREKAKDNILIHPQYEPRPPAPAIGLLELLGWNSDVRRQAFTGSALKRIKLDQLKRNALIAAGNFLAKHEHRKLKDRIEALANNETESSLVHETAKQVLRRLPSQS